jgi:RNA polymerase sigma-70 factor (ECF subfamily)
MHDEALDTFYRDEFGRVLATVIRLIGDFHVAEDAVQEAFANAFEHWSHEGWPRSPRAWLVSTARNKAIDVLRRAGRLAKIRRELKILSDEVDAGEPQSDAAIPDERLRLIFTCCHPAIAPEAQVALSLRTLCGLSTEEIARAFLVAAPTMAQRLVRAKRKIRDARASRDGDDRRLSRFQRGLCGELGRRARARRPVRRGHSPRPHSLRPVAGRNGATRLACPDAPQ